MRIRKIGRNKALRMKKKEFDNYRGFLNNSGDPCQVCEENYLLDPPHHEPNTYDKDDKYQLRICVNCHRIRHTGDVKTLKKTLVEMEEIAVNNWETYQEYEGAF